MNIADLTKKYVRLREIKAAFDLEHKNKTAKVKEAMDKIENLLLKHFSETGQDSAKTDYGTPYTTLQETFSVADRDEFLGYVKDNEAWHLLENRISKTAAQEYAKEHDGQLPPGVNYSSVRKLNVRSK